MLEFVDKKRAVAAFPCDQDPSGGLSDGFLVALLRLGHGYRIEDRKVGLKKLAGKKHLERKTAAGARLHPPAASWTRRNVRSLVN